MEYPLDQSTYHACQIAHVSILGSNVPSRRVTISYSALDDRIAYSIMMMTETVLADDAEERDRVSNG